MLERLRENRFEIRFESHAAAILEKDFPEALEQLEQCLTNLAIPIVEIIGSGGGETKGTQRMRRAFRDLGWIKHNFVIRKIIDGIDREALSHEVDQVKEFRGKKLALEIEWNNKDPFFDRDLENLKRLHAEGVRLRKIDRWRLEGIRPGKIHGLWPRPWWSTFASSWITPFAG